MGSATKSKEHRLSVLRQRSAVASLYLGQKGQDNDVEHDICKIPFPTVSRYSEVTISIAWPELWQYDTRDFSLSAPGGRPGARR